MINESKIYAFNNSIETGLRMLTILTAAFPHHLDLDYLVYFDYIVVHSGDLENEITSLHPAVPNRNGELLIRRTIIQNGLEVFIYKGLLIKYYSDNGITYGASELASPFLEALNETYTEELIKRAIWVIQNFGHLDLQTLRSITNKSLSNIRNEFNLEIVK